MKLTNTKETFGLVSIVNHWVTATLVVVALGIGLVFEDMARGALKSELFGIHMSIGVLVLTLALLRIGWRSTNPTPAPAVQTPGWQQTASRIAHWALILLILLMPLTGILTQVGEGRAVGLFGVVLIPASGREIGVLEEIGETIHGVGANLLIGLIALHVLAALKHHVYDRDATLARMLGRAQRTEALGGA